MNIQVNSTYDTLLAITKIIPEIRSFLKYACGDDSYFVVMLGKETKAIYMFTDFELLVSFIEINTAFETAQIESFSEPEQAVDYIYSLTTLN